MFHQMLADPGPVGDHIDAEMQQLRRRANTRPHQDRRRMGRTAGDDHLVGANLAQPLRTFDRQPGQPGAVEVQPLDFRPVEDFEIGPRAHFYGEIGDVSGDPLVVDIGDRDGEIAVFELGVHVVEIGEAFRFRRLHHRRRVAGPDVGKQAPHADRPVRAMVRSVEIPV